MAREVLVDVGIISRDEAVASLNADLLALADSPYAIWPYTRLRRSVETTGYSQGSMKFNYYRGALMAARWDHRLEAREGTGLGRLLRSMIAEAGDTDGRMPEDRFFEIGAEHGLDIEGDFDRYVLKGEPIVPPPDYAEGYELVTVRVPRFDLGFDVAASRSEGTVAGVREDGPAYRAGLRDGMTLVRTRNTSRDTNSWDADAPAVIVVRDGGEERAIAYMPAGELHEVEQYVRTPAGKKPGATRED
jgi:predicted metalloprotease with PDZ domain